MYPFIRAKLSQLTQAAGWQNVTGDSSTVYYSDQFHLQHRRTATPIHQQFN